jgi:putative ABC transport system permease protein
LSATDLVWAVPRRLRFEPWITAAMLLVVAATSFFFAALPRLFNHFADDALRFSLTHASLEARNGRVLEPGRIAAAEGNPLALVAARGAREEQSLPKALRALVERRTFLVHSTNYGLQTGPRSVPDVTGLIRLLALRMQSGIEHHVRLVAGHFPRTSDERVRAVDRRIPDLPRVTHVPLVQIALSTATARDLRLHLNDRAIFTVVLGDLQAGNVPIKEQRPLAVKLVGLFDVKGPRAPYWFDDPTLATPEVQLSEDAQTTTVFAQALTSAAQYPTVLAATRPLPLSYEYRYFFDPGRVNASGLDDLSAATARVVTASAGAGPNEKRLETGLGGVLERYRAARSQAETLLAVAVIGLLACALANLGLLATLSYERRRREIELIRTRGGSSAQLLAGQAVEAAVIAAPAAVAGWALAEVTVPGRGSSTSALLAVVILAGTIGLMIAAVVGVVRRPPGPLVREDLALARPSPRRLALEGLVAVAAILAAYLLRRRGLEGTGTQSHGFDPYLAAVPVLLGLACGILAVRVYPLPLAAAARLTRRLRGVALHLAVSRAARQSEAMVAPLLVLIVALAVASFSAVMLTTIGKSQNRTAWRAVGADVRVDAAPDQTLPSKLLSRLEGSGRVARAYIQDAGAAPEGEATPLLALDLDAYQRLVAGTPAAVEFPGVLRKPAQIPGAVAASVSSRWPGQGFFQVALPRNSVSLVSVATRDSLPGIPSGTQFALVSLQALQRQSDGPLPPNRIYLRGVNESAVRQSVRALAPDARVASRAAVVDQLGGSPLVHGVRSGFRAAVVVAALFASLAVALLALIAGRSRSRDVALVRTMGGSRQETSALAAVELVPLVASGAALGIGLGIAIPYLIAPGLDLAFFTGSNSNPIAVAAFWPLVLVAGLVAVVGAALLVVDAQGRRSELDRALRIGER